MRQTISHLAVFSAFGLAILFIHSWFVAFAGGGRAVIALNMFHEMWIELLLWLVWTPLMGLGLHYYLAEIKAGE